MPMRQGASTAITSALPLVEAFGERGFLRFFDRLVDRFDADGPLAAPRKPRHQRQARRRPTQPVRCSRRDAAQAQNLMENVQQLPQHPVGFADIVEKVKPAVISVRVKIDRPADPSVDEDDLPFPPGSPFERFFKRFGMPGAPGVARPEKS
jgi:S1-C subfamily serine protease